MIIYNVASYKRPEGLLRAIDSIFDQCDRINIALNSYESIPPELCDKKISIFITNNDLGDAYKFIQLMNSDGYFFTIDDDIVYPADYTNRMVDAVEMYDRKSIVTMHGRKYTKFPIDSMFERESEVYHFVENVHKDTEVDIGGTGVMCFHTDLMKIPLTQFPIHNMADIWVARWAMDNDVKIICAAHPADYLKGDRGNESIYLKTKNDNKIHTAIINSILVKRLFKK